METTHVVRLRTGGERGSPRRHVGLKKGIAGWLESWIDRQAGRQTDV